jgi:gliding motility-associated-like protein
MKQLLTLVLLCCSFCLFAQEPGTSCGQQKAMENLFLRNPQLKAFHQQIESRLYEYNRTKGAKTNDEQTPAAVVSLPVVVHIIHNNGPENISDARVQTAIQHLNEAFANTGYYDPADGVNTQIQFCLAKRDPNGNATSGINRVVSPLTVMNGWEDYSVDLAVKDLSRWNPRCYINIWVVKDITGGVAGYAYLPSAHGSDVDGIMLEAGYFGSSNANDIVVIHEMGHYLGLYHTFQGGCSNNDCAADGDRVCDTPPDQSTAGIGCNSSMNSCTTDTQSGFSTDQNDLTKAYMDYGNWNCMKIFTQGQSDRMNWTILNIRKSLLNCRSCQDPCPAPIVANFNSSANNIGPGTLVNFTNTSSNAIGYRWYLNNVLQSTATNFSYTFNTAGMYVVRLVALPGSVLCDSTFKTDTIRVTCPVRATFTPLSTSSNTNVTVNFTNTSTGATTYNWFVNGTLQGTGINFFYAFTNPGNYSVKLRATNGTCADSIAGAVVIIDTCIRQTFQKIYGGAGDDVAYDVRSTTDGGYIMAGKTNSFGSGNYDGYVVKTDALGNVQWTKTYGGTAEDVINKIMQTADGGYVFVGTTRSYGSTASDAWVVKIDGTGAVQWARRFGENTANGEQGTSICLTSDGGYAIIGNHNSAPFFSNVLVLKLDANGNLVWGKVFDSGNTDGSGYITQDGDVLMATGFTRTSLSYHDALVMKIDIANGNLLWMYRYEIGGRNNFAGEIYKTGNQYKFHVPSIQDFTFLNTGRNIILTLDNGGNATAVQELIPPDNGTGPVVMAPDGGIVAAYSEQNVTSEFNIMKLGSAGGIQWAKKYTRPGPQLSYILRHSQDGGYITVGASNPAANNDIYFAKVDALGNSGGCDTASIAVSITTPPYSSGSFSWSINRNAAFNPQNITVQSSSPVTPSTILCSGTTCIQPPPPEDDDTCTASTFQKLLSLRGSESAYDVKRGIGGGLIVAGKTDAVTNAGTQDALLIKTDRKGNIEWSKTYAGPGNDAFHYIEQTKDGNYIAVGTGKFSTQHQQDILIAKIAPNGNLIWSKAYGAGTPFGEIGVTVAETDDGGFGISVDYNSSSNTVQPLYMKVDANGNLLWSKLLTSGGGEGIHVVAQGDVLIGAGISNSASTTFADGFLVKFRQSDGALLWTKKIESQNRSNRILGLSRRGNELHINMFNSDSWIDGNVTPLVFRTDTSGNVTYSRSYELSGINRQRLQTNSLPTSDGGAIAAISEWQTNVSPKLVKIAPDGQVTWAKNYTAFSRLIVFRNLEDTSGYAVVGEAVKQGANTTQHILLMKTNSNGFLLGNGCPVTSSVGADNAITVQSTAVNGSTYFNISSGNLQSLNAPLTVTSVTMNIETLCIDSTQCEVPEDTCDVTTFIRHYSTDEVSSQFLKVIKTADNNILAVGVASDNIPGQLGQFMIVKLRKDGSIIWQKKDVGQLSHAAVNMINTADNNYLFLFQGANAGSTGFYLLKIDKSGNTLWKKDFLTDIPSGKSTVKVIEGSDGNFYILGFALFGIGTGSELWLTKVTSTGVLAWSKTYHRAITNYRLTPYDMEDDGNAVVLSGRFEVGGVDNGFLVRIIKTDGSVDWAKRYGVAGEVSQFLQLNKFNGQLVVNARGTFGSNYLFRVNAAGAITKARKLTAPSQTATGTGMTTSRQYISNKGEIVSVGAFNDIQTTSRLMVFKLDSSWTPLWVRKYDPLTSFITTGVFETNGNIFAGGFTNIVTSVNKPTIIKLTSEGELVGCRLDSVAMTVSTPDVTTQDFNFATIQNVAYNNLAVTTTTGAGNLNMGFAVCEGSSVCNMLELVGPDTVCNSLDTVTFSTKRDSTCTGKVRWAVDTAYVKIVSQTDSTIKVIFKRSGSVKLVASMIMPCDTLRDSITIAIMQPKDSLNLGPDKLLCKISTLTLNAGAGFKTYRWQDGTADSIYTVTMPGTYSVEATDSCGNILSDTVVIAQAPDVPFDLGADRAKCDNDTLTITAPAGFTKYSWADNYNISNRYTQTVKVWPSADTTYTVIAETLNGCLVYDSVRITLKTAPPLDLGADTSFCRNDSVIINAASGFTSYLWNTGETSQQIIAKNKGLYHVSAQAPNGCIVRDSLEVLNVYALPIANLGVDTMICMNSNYTFNAGNHVSYLWQDGSTARTFTTSAVGKYWVQVTDGNHCVSSDTVQILKYKNCGNSIDFPNAFTPNNDRRHETYKPIVKGNISKYRFTIFNRWGQRVFETTQINYAWDGTIGGKLQDTGTFVWICEYQFAGEEKKVAKGTLLLVR